MATFEEHSGYLLFKSFHIKLKKNYCTVYLLSLVLLQFKILSAQDTISTIQKQKDIIEVLKKLIVPNFKTKDSPDKLEFSAVPAAGYAMHTGWAGIVTANLAFYTNKIKNTEQKISSLATNLTYTQYKQFMLPVQGNIWTNENKFNFIIDWRYIKYPSKVFGLGSNSASSGEYMVNYNGLKIHQTILTSIAKNWYAGLGFYFDKLWSIKELDPPSVRITDFQKYGIEPNVVANGPVMKILYDSRLNTINPQGGGQMNVTYRPSMSDFRSTNGWQSLQLEFRKFIKFPEYSRNILALWNHNWFTTGGKPPFLMLPSTGWDDSYNLGRGYIQGRFRDRNMIYLESEYRFHLSNNGLIGGVVFMNGQTYSTSSFKGYKGIIPGYGFGLRIKVNKYSGANICIDYGFGKDGSRGFAVNLGEIF